MGLTNMDQDKFVKLLTRQLTGQLTSEEAEELRHLLDRNEDYRTRYKAIQEYLSNDFQTEASGSDLFEKVKQKIAAKGDEESFVAQKRVRLSLIWQVAAVLLLISSVIFIVKVSNIFSKRSTTSQLVTTPRAVRKIINLSDGTTVTLNADSKLRFPDKFEGPTREVYLNGEAFFDVHHDSSHPFIIHTIKMDVKVLGTAFDLKAYPEDDFSETTLIRGRVQVTLRDRPSDIITLKPSEKLVVKYLAPASQTKNDNEQAAEALPEVTHLHKQDSTVVETSWVTNKIAFQDERFGDLAKQLERAYNVHFVFQNDHVKNLTFSGVFEQETIEEALHAMSLIEPFQYQIEENQIIIK
jgi:ferric-dicitrate binding protein FerR (iron transport regulator)